MTVRWYMGLHPTLGVMGCWLSKPGIDARYATANSDFLLSPSIKNEQLVMSGTVYVPGAYNNGAGVPEIAYPIDLSRRPYIFMKIGHAEDGNVEHPYSAFQEPTGAAGWNTSRVTATIFRNKVRFNNANESNINLDVHYMIFYRSVD